MSDKKVELTPAEGKCAVCDTDLAQTVYNYQSLKYYPVCGIVYLFGAIKPYPEGFNKDWHIDKQRGL